MILPALTRDPTFPYSPDAFDAAYEELVDFCLRRAAGVREQLNSASDNNESE